MENYLKIDLLNINASNEGQYNYSVTENNVSICALNDDCLIYIFQLLPIADKVRIERVCKYWQQISRKSWRYCKTLTLCSEVWGLKESKGKFIKNAHIIYEVLKRCGPFLKSLEFFGYIDELLKVGTEIGSLCPNLESIDLSGVSSYIIRNIAEHCTNIRHFYLRDTIDPYNEELSLLLSRNKNLKSLLILCEYEEAEGRYLLDLPFDSLESLSILSSNISSYYFQQAAKNFKNLSRLSLDVCNNFDDETLEAISNIKTLQEIQTGQWLGRINSLNPITKLENLKSVELSSSNYVNDEFLIALSEHCRQLSDVNISGCKVTDKGVAFITDLPKLEHLNLDLLHVSDKAFNPMPNLKTLRCFRCKYVSNKCFSQIIESSKNLAVLDVSYCKVKKSIVEIAINVTNQRRNNVTLVILARGTKIVAGKSMQVSPFLQIIFDSKRCRTKDYL